MKTAVCLEDNFRYDYDPNPTAAWLTLMQTVLTHSVLEHGAFKNTHWVPVGD